MKPAKGNHCNINSSKDCKRLQIFLKAAAKCALLQSCKENEPTPVKAFERSLLATSKLLTFSCNDYDPEVPKFEEIL